MNSMNTFSMFHITDRTNKNNKNVAPDSSKLTTQNKIKETQPDFYAKGTEFSSSVCK